MSKAATKTNSLFNQVCRQFRLPEPVAEYQFCPGRKWRADYYFEANGRRVALEVEGGIWTNGRHTRPQGFAGDMEKYNAMSQAGIFLIRVTPGNLMKTETFTMIKNVLYGQY